MRCVNLEKLIRLTEAIKIEIDSFENINATQDDITEILKAYVILFEISELGLFSAAYNLRSSHTYLPDHLVPIPEGNTAIENILNNIQENYGLNVVENFETPYERNFLTNIISIFLVPMFVSFIGCLGHHDQPIHPYDPDNWG